MIRLGLCCKYNSQPITFRTTTATYLARTTRRKQLAKLSALIRHNAESLQQAIAWNARNGIGAFRVNSQILPLYTHPTVGYDMADLPDGKALVALFRRAGRLAREYGMRLSFHPDQFVVVNSQKPAVVAASIRELAYQAQVAEWIGADVINIHGGGAYGDKAAALARLRQAIDGLPRAVRRRLTLENDDRTFTPKDLLPVCRATGTPLVYDVHHHRCKPDGLTIEQATTAALATWDREPLFHISSPRDGWAGPRPQRHHDYIAPADIPDCWRALDLTLEVEAKAKEDAIARLQRHLSDRGVAFGCTAATLRQQGQPPDLRTERTSQPNQLVGHS